MNNLDYLEHYGVKGMQWGRRKLNREARKDERSLYKNKRLSRRPAKNRKKIEAVNKDINYKIKNVKGYSEALGSRVQKQTVARPRKKAALVVSAGLALRGAKMVHDSGIDKLAVQRAKYLVKKYPPKFVLNAVKFAPAVVNSKMKYGYKYI